MKTLIVATLAALVAATAVSRPVAAQELKVHLSESPLSGSSTATIANARNALGDYLSACTAHDLPGITKAMTADAEVEYAGDVPGRYLAMDLNTMEGCWAGLQSVTATAGAANLWIYPTSSADVVFVHLIAEEGTGRNVRRIEHLAMVQLRGARIAQIREFTSTGLRSPGALAVNQ